MGKRGRSLRDLRAEYDAAEARGLVSKTPEPKKTTASEPARATPGAKPGLKVVWCVCDQGGRVVATFAYPEREQAEAHAEALKERGKGKFFVKSDKVRMG